MGWGEPQGASAQMVHRAEVVRTADQLSETVEWFLQGMRSRSDMRRAVNNYRDAKQRVANGEGSE